MNTIARSRLTPFSLQDFPGLVSCILWFSGCNFRCSYCHNPELVNTDVDCMASDELEAFLQSRKGKLDGVVFSGGECTLSPKILEMAKLVKSFGLKLKIDTNGSRPQVLQTLFDVDLVDAVAMDFKAPFESYGRVAAWRQTELWKESFKLIQRSDATLEIRTTVNVDLIDERAVSLMMRTLRSMGYRGAYYLQNFREGDTLGDLGKPSRRFDPELLPELEGIQIRLRNFN